MSRIYELSQELFAPRCGLRPVPRASSEIQVSVEEFRDPSEEVVHCRTNFCMRLPSIVSVTYRLPWESSVPLWADRTWPD